MFEISEVKSTACETIYNVVSGDDAYHVRLWIISGITGALAFATAPNNYSYNPSCTRRFDVASMWRNAVWLTGEGKYAHQNREPDGGLSNCPTIENALPRRMDDFMEWFDWATVERVRLLAAKADKDRLEKIGKVAGRPYSAWGAERAPEEPARLLNSVKPYPDSKPYTWRTTGAWLAHSMKGAKSEGAVRFNGEITIGIAVLRTYCKAIRHDVIDLTLEPATDALYIATVTKPGAKLRAHRTTFKAGAFDKYQGANGYTCAVTFSDTATVALDNRKHRPNKYDPFTLDPVTRRKAKPTTLDVVVSLNRKEVNLPWTGFESDTPGLVVTQEPVYNELLTKDGEDVWEGKRGHWQITHRDSGLLVRDYRIKTKAAALKVADNLGDLLDWTQTMAQINDELSNSDVRRDVSDGIAERYAAGGATGMPGY